MNEQTFTSDPIRLAAGVKLMIGPDRIPLLHITDRQVYVKLGATAVEIMRLIEDRRAVIPEDICRHLRDRYHIGEKRVRRLLVSFLTGLDEAGALAHVRS
jgi:Coenzyme PQQ synthesis protein D (PqqD)